MNSRSSFLILTFTIATVQLVAQSNTMYYLTGAPQVYRLNPATQPQCSFFFGIPVINSFYLETYNNSFGLTDVIWNDPVTNEVVHPLSSEANLNEFLNKLNDDNSLSLELGISPISMGLGIKDMYFTFDITTKFKQGLYIPADFVPIILTRIDNGRTYDFSSLGIEFTSYIEYAVGVSRKFSDILTVGIRPKLITGVYNISSKDNNESLYTYVYNYEFNSQIDLQICTPGFFVPENENGVLDPTGEFVFDSTLSGFSDYRKLVMTNKGLGIDIGVHYKPIEDLTLSASLIDLGYIKWKEYIHTATLNGSLTYEGIEYEVGQDTSNFFDDFLDTLRSNFEVTGSSEPYKTGLEPKLYLGCSLALLPSLDVGLLSRFDFLTSGTKANVMIHANWHPSSAFNLTASYSPFDGRASTFGLGFSLRGGPITFYTVADYRAFRYNLYKYEKIPVFIAPSGRSRFNTQIGLNITIGCNKRKKLMKDRPMYFSTEY